MRKVPSKSLFPGAAALALAIVTFGVFFQVHNFGFIVYDDQTYVAANPQIQGGLTAKNFAWAFTATRACNWHPLTWLSLMLDRQIFGPDPGWFHLINLFLHIANVVLLFAVFFRMTKALWPSVFVAAAFALHPLHIQSVAWVAERKDVLSALFWILTIICYVRYVERPSMARYAVTILIFVFGLMAKPMLVSLPFVLLLLDYWPIERAGSAKVSVSRLILEKVPLFIFSAASCVITLVVQQRTGAVGDIAKFPLGARVANAFVSYVNYITKMFWPANLSIFYPHPGGTFDMTKTVFAACVLIAITIFVIRLARTHRYLFVGWMWYIITLVPVIGLVQVGDQAMADRYTYIPLVGLFLIIAWGVPELLAKYNFRKAFLAVAATAVVLAMSVCTYVQLRYWQNSVTILEHAIEVTQNNRLAYANLGVALLQNKMFDESIVNFEKALQIDPCDAMSHLNIAVALCHKDKVDRAIEHFEKSLQIDPGNAMSHFNFGIALTRQGKIRQAIEQYDEALRIDPCFTDAIELRQKLMQQRQ